MRPPHRPTLRRPAIALLAVALLLAACADASDPAAAGDGDGDAGPAIEVTSCEREQRLDAPPERIVSLNQHVTEILLDLGLGQQIVGIGYAGDDDGPVEHAEEYARLPALADEYPDRERLLDVEPDLVVGGMSSAFDEQEGRGREDLEAQGMATFLFEEYCSDEAVDVDLVVDDLRRLGILTGTEDAMEEVLDELTGRLAAVRERLDEAGVAPVPTFVYDSGESQPMTIGGVGMGNLVVELAGGVNLFDGIDRPYGDASWEQVAERAPEAIVVLDYGETPVEDKHAFLADQPLAATTPAMVEGRVAQLPLRDLFQGPRMADAVEHLARQLHPEVVEG